MHARYYSHGPVSVSVCMSQVGVLQKRPNTWSHKQNRTIAQEFYFLMRKISVKFDRGHPIRGRQMQMGWVKIGGLFMTPIGQWKRLDRIMVECKCLLHIAPLQLHNFDLFRTSRTSSFCTVAWQLARFQLARRIARSLGDSWASCFLTQQTALDPPLLGRSSLMCVH